MEIILQSDTELVNRTLHGESVAYEALFERYRSSILSMLLARCHDEALCDDLLQEAFIKAYLNLEKFNPAYSFAGWIMTIARNLFIDYTRRRGEAHNSVECTDSQVCTSPNPEQCYIDKEDNRRIRIALERLPAPYRTIIEMRFWRDMTYEQISEELGIPMGTVKTQIHRARRAFICILG